MQCSGVALISSRRGPFCNLPLTHVNSFVAQFVYVQIGSHDGVVAGGGYITGGEARQTQSPSQTQPRPHPSRVAKQPVWVHLIWLEPSEKAHEDKSQGRPEHSRPNQPRQHQGKCKHCDKGKTSVVRIHPHNPYCSLKWLPSQLHRIWLKLSEEVNTSFSPSLQRP